MNTYGWYQQLIKPAWAPPAWLFGPVWTILYVIIAVSFGTVFYRALTGKISRKTAVPFGLNLIFNLAFTPIQFGLKNNILAATDILLTVGTLIWALMAVRRDLRWVTVVNIPYLLWGLYATGLQLTVTYLNS